MKKFILYIALCSIAQTHAEEWKQPADIFIGSTQEASGKSNTVAPDFELRNKSNNAILVYIKQGDDLIVPPLTIPASQSTSKEELIQVLQLRPVNNNRNVAADDLFIGIGPVPEKPLPFPDTLSLKIFKLQPEGKDVFVSYENNAVRTQKGRFGKSQTGHALRNNIGSGKIRLATPDERRAFTRWLAEPAEQTKTQQTYSAGTPPPPSHNPVPPVIPQKNAPQQPTSIQDQLRGAMDRHGKSPEFIDDWSKNSTNPSTISGAKQTPPQAPDIRGMNTPAKAPISTNNKNETLTPAAAQTNDRGALLEEIRGGKKQLNPVTGHQKYVPELSDAEKGAQKHRNAMYPEEDDDLSDWS